MHERILVVLILVAGCEEAERNGPDCKASAEELATFLAATDHELPVVSDSELDRLHLVMRTDLPRGPVAPAPIVLVSPTHVTVNGSGMKPDELAAELARQARAARDAIATGRSQAHLPAQSSRLLLVVDGGADWGAVARIAAAAAEAGFDRLALLFERPAATRPPPRTATDDELDAVRARYGPIAFMDESGEREVERIASRLTRSCDAVPKLLASVTRSNRDKAELLIRGIAPALVACNCRVDMPSLRSRLWRLIGLRHPTSALEITLAPDARRVDLPAATPWREASQRLEPGQTVWLVAH